MSVLKSVVAVAIAAATLVSLVVSANAQSAYPAKPVKVVVPFGAGGPTDVIARLVAEKLSQRWGHQFVVENLVGAGGNTAAGAVAKATPDGYTLMAVSTSYILNPSLYKKVPYDLKTTFVPITLFAQTPNIISVHPSVPARTMKELVELIKATPGKYSYAQPGNGSTPHLHAELLKLQLGLDLAMVSHNSAAAAITNTLGGHTPMAFTVLPAAQPHIQAGNLFGIAVLAKSRVPGLPNVPTMAEAGFLDQESDTLTGFVAPAGTPKEIVEKLQAEMAKLVAEPEVKKQLDEMGFGAVASTPAEFAARIERESVKWDKIIKDAKIRVE